MTEDTHEWILAVFGSVVSDAEMKRAAMDSAAQLRNDDDPPIHIADVDAARAYLRTSLLRRSLVEIQGMSAPEFAGLWGRGALGAARYRAAGGSGRSRRTKRDEPTVDGRARRGANRGG